MRSRLISAAVLVLVLATGCARKGLLKEEEPLLSGGPRSLKATAIVELRWQKTEKGRALITASSPDYFSIEIFGPLGVRAALIKGDSSGLVFSGGGKKETLAPDDPRLPINIRAEEFVALLLGSNSPRMRSGATSHTDTLPGGHAVTVRQRGGKVLYRATMKDYRETSGYSIPRYISIEGGGFKLIVKYRRVNINPDIKKRDNKTES